ncbi:MAG: sulfurase [Eggerthellaceae bacterium]
MEQARKQQVVARGRVRSINVSKRKGTRKTPRRRRDRRRASGPGYRRTCRRLASPGVAAAWESIEKGARPASTWLRATSPRTSPPRASTCWRCPGTRVHRRGRAVGAVADRQGVPTKCAIYHLAGDCIFPREASSSWRWKAARSTWATRWKSSHSATAPALTPPEALAELAAARG